MRFCLDDGTTLIDKSDSSDPPPTLVFPNNVPVATIKAVFPPEVAPSHHPQWPPANPAVHKKRSVLPWFLGIGALLLIGSGIILAILVFRPKRSLTWHLTLETEQGTP